MTMIMKPGRLLFSLLVLLVTYAGIAKAQTYEEGRSAYIRGDYSAAYAILRPLADAGDPEAQKMMGIMYDYGHGVGADAGEALQWYIRSAEQGQTAVQYQVGAKYFKGENTPQDYTEAARWWAMAADGGQVDAQFNLGLMYFRGLGLPQDDALAADLFRRAADQDHAHAQYSLAVMYAFGRGVEKNYDTALQWFTKAADKGVAQAQYNLGIFYENGYGVETDTAKAREWYQRAAAQGLTEAVSRLEGLSNAAISGPVATADPVPVEPPVTAAVNTPDPVDSTATPVTGYSLSEIATNGIRREDWVLQQRPDSYTLQIGSVTAEEDIVRFLQSEGIEDNSAYIEVVVDGTTRYSAFYGVYSSYAEAEQAIAGLPDSLRRVNPWVRNFGILQKMLN